MAANANDALFFLVKTLLNLYLGALLLRILLQWHRADFFNPISQLVWKVTQPPLAPFRNAIPKWRRLDTAALLLLYLLCYLFIQVVMWMLGVPIGIVTSLIYALLKVLAVGVTLYTISLFAQAILSWIGPGVSNPAANVLWSLNEPLLRPVRRVIPPIAGLDLSPLVLILALQFFSRLLPLPRVFY